jgi:hypothetical protein
MSKITSPKPAECAVLPSERGIYDDFAAALYVEAQPEGPFEEHLFAEILRAAWNMRRVRILEAQLAASGRDPLDDDALAAKLDRLEKFHAASERSYQRNMRQLKETQTNRCLRDTMPEEVRDALPAAACLPPIIKRLEQYRQPQNLQAEFANIVREDWLRDAAAQRQNEANPVS